MAASGSHRSSLPGQWSLLREVDYKRTTWAVKVRCVRVYRVPPLGRSGNTLEIVFHDQEGTRMHAQVKENDIPEFEKVIKEGKVFKLRNFLVIPDFLTFKTCVHKYMMQFISTTLIRQISITYFPSEMFEFMPFDRLLQGTDINEGLLIDVIGRVVSRTTEQSHNHFQTPRRIMELTLEDNNGATIGVTLWNEYVVQADAYLSRDSTKPVILILQMVRARKYQGTYGLSTAYNATKLIFDADLRDVAAFREGLPEQIGNSPAPLSIILTPPSRSKNTEIENGDLKITPIGDLLTTTKGGVFWILGDIVSIENYKEWCYLACENCNKKVIPEGEGFKCTGQNCEALTKEGIYRYKITVRIADKSAHVPMTLWDRECTELIGRPCSTMRWLLQRETGSLESFPLKEIAKKMLKRRALFKISLRDDKNDFAYQNNRFFSVWSMILSHDIVETYEKKMKEAEEDDFWKELENAFWDEVEEVVEEEENFTGITPETHVNPKRKHSSTISQEEEIVKNLEEELEFDQADASKKMKMKLEK